MKLSETAWKKSEKIIAAIKQHPFNIELMKGTLAENKFAYYIEQDSIYLQDFARALAQIASKVPVEYVRTFLRFSNYSFIAEQEIVHQFFRQSLNLSETGKITPATLSYTSYLHRICAIEPVAVAVAAVLPCFWVYYEVGTSIAKQSKSNNSYARWIETYASEEFATSVAEMLAIFEDFAKAATPEVQQKMVNSFYKSTCLEWHFWHDAYHQRVFDNVDQVIYQA